MNKTEFLGQLRTALHKLPQYEIDQSLAFYAEMIDDRIEDGIPEEEAIASLGTIQDIAKQIIAETPLVPKTIAKAKTGSRALNIVLLIVFSPIWVPLALAFVGAVLSIYLAIWAVIIALWAAVLALVLAGVVSIFSAFFLLTTPHPLATLFASGVGLSFVGVGLFCFFGILTISRGLFRLTTLFARKIRSLFIKEGSVA